MTILYNELNFTCQQEVARMIELLELYNGSDLNFTFLAKVTFGELKRVGFDPSGGLVWLEDEDYNRLMINQTQLDLCITTPSAGREGFLEDLLKMDDLDEEDLEYLREMKENAWV